jgi:APA family basic amino acid/polyamine antiporter
VRCCSGAFVVVVSVRASLGAMLMMAPRLYFAMARDHLFPAAAAVLHPRFGTPVRAIGAQAILASVLVAIGSFETIVAYFIFVSVGFIALTVASVFILQRRDRSLAVPGYPWPAAIFLVMVAGLLVLLALNNPVQAGLGVAIVALGLPAYRVLGPRAGDHSSENTPGVLPSVTEISS